MKKTLALAILSLSGLAMGEAGAATFFQPYPTGSPVDHLIRFDEGATGNAEAPNPLTTNDGYNYSSTLATGLGGGWNLSASGSVNFVEDSTIKATSNAYTEAGGESLRFSAKTNQGQDLPGANLTMTWSGDATITGSTSWAAQTDQYRYNFSLQLDQSLVNDFPSIFDNFTLTISDTSGTLYSGVGLKQILGVAVIDQNMYKDYFVSFTYNQADGPLKIEWSGSVDMTGALIDSLGNGTQDIIRVHDTSITNEAIPEPSAYAMLSGGLLIGGMGLLRQRSRSTR